MRKFLLVGAVVASALISAGSASAGTVILNSTFESPSVATGSWKVFNAADGWTTLSGPGIEIQDHAAGAPAANGGNQFVELDSNGGRDTNSSMFYEFGQGGTFDLDFLYSQRPGVGGSTNDIEVYLDGVPLMATLAGGAALPGVNWTSYGIRFTASKYQKLIFRAVGADDSYGGYLDNIVISAVPEPATWAMMITGFGLAGSALRRRRAATGAAFA